MCSSNNVVLWWIKQVLTTYYSRSVFIRKQVPYVVELAKILTEYLKWFVCPYIQVTNRSRFQIISLIRNWGGSDISALWSPLYLHKPHFVLQLMVLRLSRARTMLLSNSEVLNIIFHLPPSSGNTVRLLCSLWQALTPVEGAADFTIELHCIQSSVLIIYNYNYN